MIFKAILEMLRVHLYNYGKYMKDPTLLRLHDKIKIYIHVYEHSQHNFSFTTRQYYVQIFYTYRQLLPSYLHIMYMVSTGSGLKT